MGSADAEGHIVNDVARNAPGSWRWAAPEPTLRIRLGRATALKYTIDFTIVDEVYKSTGPVTLTFLVNGKPVGTQHYNTTGQHHWEGPVDESLLKPFEQNLIGARIDKYWTGEDGARLGFILTRIGLVNR